MFTGPQDIALKLARGVKVPAVLRPYSPSGRHSGLLTGSQAEGPHRYWLPRLLGYVSSAFLVTCVDSSAVSVLSGAR